MAASEWQSLTESTPEMLRYPLRCFCLFFFSLSFFYFYFYLFIYFFIPNERPRERRARSEGRGCEKKNDAQALSLRGENKD